MNTQVQIPTGGPGQPGYLHHLQRVLQAVQQHLQPHPEDAAVLPAS